MHLVTPEHFGITRERGFLPSKDPCAQLPKGFEHIDELGRMLPDLLGSGKVRKAVQDLPETPPHVYLNPGELKLFKLRLDFIVSAYRYQNAHQIFASKGTRSSRFEEEQITIPAHIARPLVDVSQQLGVPPILCYSFYALHNWQRLDQAYPIAVENTRLLQHFLGGIDERHFILIHVEIEENLAPAVYAILSAQQGILYQNISDVARQLEIIAFSIDAAVTTMRRMPEACHPDVYYLRVRPYIFGFNLPGSPGKVVFAGIEPSQETMPILRGETGAQTPSYPALWAALGIEFPNDALKAHVTNLRQYLLPKHREFIGAIEHGPSIRTFVQASRYVRGGTRLREAYNTALHALHRFFKLHLKYADEYINKKAARYRIYHEQGMFGTGGTPYREYLKHHCTIILNHRI